ncbi:MAG: hypothetical protein EZS28_050038, partial [Streblomastix strix]
TGENIDPPDNAVYEDKDDQGGGENNAYDNLLLSGVYVDAVQFKGFDIEGIYKVGDYYQIYSQSEECVLGYAFTLQGGLLIGESEFQEVQDYIVDKVDNVEEDDQNIVDNYDVEDQDQEEDDQDDDEEEDQDDDEEDDQDEEEDDQEDQDDDEDEEQEDYDEEEDEIEYLSEVVKVVEYLDDDDDDDEVYVSVGELFLLQGNDQFELLYI